MKTLKLSLSVLVLSIFFFAGCSTKYVATEIVPNWEEAGVKKVIVVPFIAMPEGDAILTGVVTRYEEREGGPIGIKKPASVGFEARLINAKDGKILWAGKYAETQKSLTDDLSMFFIFIRRGGEWLTAEQLTRYGVSEMLKTMPKAGVK